MNSFSMNRQFLHSHIDFIPEHLGEFCEEQEERFHQDIAVISKVRF